ncbi:hypothetical protein EVG20_g11164, partial [Dentipellis fragilis]
LPRPRNSPHAAQRATPCKKPPSAPRSSAAAPLRSPRDSQVSALELAAARLQARAQEARDRVAALREVMADEGLDNATYERLQRERWLEERWLAKAKAEAEAKQPAAGEKENVRPAADADAEHGGGGGGENDARRHANLARFFAKSPTQTAILSSHRTMLRSPLPEPRVIASPKDIEPPQLRSWPLSETLRQPMKTLRGGRLSCPAGSLSSPRPSSAPTSTSTALHLPLLPHSKRRRTNVPTPLDTLPELPSDAELSTGTGTGAETGTGTWLASAPPTASTSAFPSSHTTASSVSITTGSECGTLPEDLDQDQSQDQSNGNGYATIFRLALRPRSEILAGLQMHAHVPMPAYVADLLDEFDGVGVGINAGNALMQDDGTPHASPAKITFSAMPVPRMRISAESASLLSYDGGLDSSTPNVNTPPRTPQKAASAHGQHAHAHAHAHTSPFRRSLGLARKLSAARLRSEHGSEHVGAGAGVLGHRRSFLRHRHFRSEGPVPVPVDAFGVKSPEQAGREVDSAGVYVSLRCISSSSLVSSLAGLFVCLLFIFFLSSSVNVNAVLVFGGWDILTSCCICISLTLSLALSISSSSFYRVIYSVAYISSPPTPSTRAYSVPRTARGYHSPSSSPCHPSVHRRDIPSPPLLPPPLITVFLSRIPTHLCPCHVPASQYAATQYPYSSDQPSHQSQCVTRRPFSGSCHTAIPAVMISYGLVDLVLAGNTYCEHLRTSLGVPDRGRLLQGIWGPAGDRCPGDAADHHTESADPSSSSVRVPVRWPALPLPGVSTSYRLRMT